jgi:phosphopantothenate-cysteine ligase/phosphopantothenoylcysteine decarboxylase/phosphopantothenate--cysteine ligase
MNILVTAGNTQVPIDRVRAITNIFTGRTGAGIAVRAHERGHTVTLLTSHPEAVGEVNAGKEPTGECWQARRYRTFDDLQALMAERVRQPALDAVVHSAAVSDYRAAGIYALSKESDEATPRLIDMAAAKVKSDAPELWLRLVRTPKLVDQVRSAWGFRGVLVKFKLEVGVSDERLLEIAEQSRVQSSADLMVANTLEGAGFWAYLGPVQGQYQRICRRELATCLLEEIEVLQRGRSHA